MPFILPLFLTFHFYKVHDIFIYANFRGGALLVLNQIESCELTKWIMFLFLITGSLFLALYQLKGIL